MKLHQEKVGITLTVADRQPLPSFSSGGKHARRTTLVLNGGHRHRNCRGRGIAHCNGAVRRRRGGVLPAQDAGGATDAAASATDDRRSAATRTGAARGSDASSRKRRKQRPERRNSRAASRAGEFER